MLSKFSMVCIGLSNELWSNGPLPRRNLIQQIAAAPIKSPKTHTDTVTPAMTPADNVFLSAT